MEFHLIGGLLLLETDVDARLNRDLREVQGCQPILPALDFVGQVDTVGNIRWLALGPAPETSAPEPSLALFSLDMAVRWRAGA